MLTIAGIDFPQVGQRPLIALDKTAGTELAGITDVETTRPAAVFRVTNLSDLGISLDDLDDALLTMNGVQRRITSHKPMPAPTGQGAGEVYCFLEGV